MRVAGFIVLILLLLAVSCQGAETESQEDVAQPSGLPAGQGEISVRLELSGLRFVDPVGATTDGTGIHVVLPKAGLRRIDPGIVPDSIWIGKVVPTGQDEWRLSKLPLGTHVLLQMFLQPLASGGQPIALHLPVFVGLDGIPIYDVSIQLDGEGGTSSYAISHVKSRGEPAYEYRTRLDLLTNEVSRDTDLDGDFEDELVLPDTEGLGISRLLLARLEAENTAGSRVESAEYVGAVESVNLSAGTLTVRGLKRIGSQDPPSGELVTMSFAEDASFSRRLVNAQEERSVSVAPPELAGAEQVTLRAQRLTTSAAAVSLWLESASELRLDLPPDTVAAVPLRQAARPGEPIPVTVYVNRTARPLHELKRLNLSFDAKNRLRAGSLDPGDRGGGAAVADGAWAQAGAFGFALPNEAKLASRQLSADRAVVELWLEPLASIELNNATGALCNFELICHEDAELAVEKQLTADLGGLSTVYTGLDGKEVQWSNCLAAEGVQVSVEGEVLLLTLEEPGHEVEGYAPNSPFRVKPGERLRFAIRDSQGNDLAADPLSSIVARSLDGTELRAELGMLTILQDFRGPLRVEGSYNGIFCSSSSEINLFVDSLESFVLTIHEKETNIFDGSAAMWDLVVEERDTSVSARIHVKDARNLHACYFSLRFDPRLYWPTRVKSDIFDQLPGGVVIPPTDAIAENAGDGELTFGLCQARPQDNPGLNGNHNFVSVGFSRRIVNDALSSFPELPPKLPLEPSVQLALDESGDALVWRPYIAGDYNQDGIVSYATGDARAFGDLTTLAVLLDSPVLNELSTAGVIDWRWDNETHSFAGDGKITIDDAEAVVSRRHVAVEAWTLYRGAEAGDFPSNGQRLTMIPYSGYLGDPLLARVYYRWSPAGGDKIQPGCYWVRPLLNGVEGPSSLPLVVK